MPVLEIDFSDREFELVDRYYASAVESGNMSLEEYLKKAIVTMVVQGLEDLKWVRGEDPEATFSSSLSERECDEYGLPREYYT
ncbi:hypothetical protein RJ40_03530 [Methanofollis aquaemaris]|uniref:Uncharacterized protein n=1 Tax=Methanofollis aquaemaris TaxID=126734 RepID=A0A8A3S3Z0_9EURY|nr:hypothetical protein [Methanofollis aquaemaris]QSZ66633.1 hypothetical protein RJ40_03530 [Methanofollis aquaemaris]